MSQPPPRTNSSLNKLTELVIGLEGSIGVGKTTFGQGLKIRADADGVPCYLFLETAHQPCLPDFIAKPKVHGPAFQMLMLADCQNRVKWALSEALRGSLCVVDRTPWGNAVFEEVGHRHEGNISDEHHELYEKARDHVSLFGVHYVLFFDLSPQTCQERMPTRGNSVELQYQLKYFTRLDTVYFHRVLDTVAHRRCPVVVVPPLPLDLQTQIIHVLERVHSRQWCLPPVVLSRHDTFTAQPDTNVNNAGALNRQYEEQRNRVPDPYLGKDPPGASGPPIRYNYALFREEPDKFKRCVMWTLASLQPVVVYNYVPAPEEW